MDPRNTGRKAGYATSPLSNVNERFYFICKYKQDVRLGAKGEGCGSSVVEMLALQPESSSNPKPTVMPLLGP